MSQAAVRLLGDGDGSKVCIGKLKNVDDFLYIYLDLDVCVPQWMRVSASFYQYVYMIPVKFLNSMLIIKTYNYANNCIFRITLQKGSIRL